MIPNNQFYYNNGKQGATSTYYLRQILPDDVAATPAQSDGPSLVSYGGNLLQMFGWLGASQSNKVYSSSDLGRTFTELANGPDASAEQQAEIRADGKLWVWPISNGTGKIYNYDGTWHLVSNNYPSTLNPINILFNDKLLAFGGQLEVDATPVNDNNVYRYNDGTDTWDIIGQTPTDVWLCTGCAWANGAYIYATGGAKVTSFIGTYDFLNDKIIRSSDGGVTWSVFATLPANMRAMWPETLMFDDNVWYLNGYSSGANQDGLWKSSNNGQQWDLFTDDIPGRHATALCVHDDSLYIGWGNFWNDLYRVEKIVYPEQGFIVPAVQTWWEKNWPADRPTNSLLTAVNALFNTLNTDISLNPAKTQLQTLDYFGMIAGIENENQFLVPMLSTNTNYLNSVDKIQGDPTWTTNGASSVAGSNEPTYLLDWNPNNYAVNFSLNSASFFDYILSDLIHEFYDFGNINAYIVGHSADSGGRLYGTANSPDFAVGSVTTGKGYRGIGRLDASNINVVVNTTNTAVVKAATSAAASRFSVCGLENGGGTYGSPNVFGAAGIGSGELDHNKMRTALQAFFTTRGVAY